MPRLLARQQSSPQSQERLDTARQSALLGDSILINGIDPHAVRRAHMRAQTTARQAAEGRADKPVRLLAGADQAARSVERRGRDAVKVADLAAIEGDHQAWLQAQEGCTETVT